MSWAYGNPSADLNIAIDEFSDEQRLTVSIQSARLTETNAREGASLVFHCREGEDDNPLLVALIPSGSSGIEPRREPIADAAAQLAADDADGESEGSDWSYHRAVLEAYAGRVGTGDTAVLVPVKLRFDEKPMRAVTWWWADGDAGNAAISLLGGGFDILVEAVKADRAIAKIHRSPTFRFDLSAARPAISEFVARCVETWEPAQGGERPD